MITNIVWGTVPVRAQGREDRVRVRFNYPVADAAGPAWRQGYQRVIQQAIEATRPASESWSITMVDEGDVIRIQFSCGSCNGTHSLPFSPRFDDGDSRVLDRALRQFLWSTWAGGIDAFCPVSNSTHP